MKAATKKAQYIIQNPHFLFADPISDLSCTDHGHTTTLSNITKPHGYHLRTHLFVHSIADRKTRFNSSMTPPLPPYGLNEETMIT